MGGLLGIGTQRSGTTLLNRVLNGHPDIAMLYDQSNFLRIDPPEYGRPPAELLKAARAADWKEGRNWDGLPAPQAGNPETVYQAIIRHFTGVSQSKYWGEKYAGRCIDALKFLDVTDGKIIHTVRDPRDVCASEKRRLVSLRGGDAERHFLFMLYDWTVGLFIGEYISRVAPERYHRIRYEDLVCDPERVLRGVCQFLGLPFDTKMIDVRTFSDDEGRAWEANSFFSSAFGICAISAIAGKMN